MSKYTVRYTEQAVKQLKKLDKNTRRLIYSWIDKNLMGTENPYAFGKGLTANRTGQWRYRVGDYRIIAKISGSSEQNEDKKELIILILAIGHRRDIYN